MSRTVIEDLFMHALSRSRSIQASYKAAAVACIRDTDPSADDALMDHQLDVSAFLAAIAPAVVHKATEVAAVLPGGGADLANLPQPAVVLLMRPMFEAAGIGEDFDPE